MHRGWLLLLLAPWLGACPAPPPREPHAADEGRPAPHADAAFTTRQESAAAVGKHPEPAALGYRPLAVAAGHAALLRIDPREGDSGFHGHNVLARRVLSRDDALRVGATVALGVALGGPMARCFEPGYGIRATRAGASTEIGLCFDCTLIRFYGAGPGGTDLDLPLGKEILPDVRELEPR